MYKVKLNSSHSGLALIAMEASMSIVQIVAVAVMTFLGVDYEADPYYWILVALTQATILLSAVCVLRFTKSDATAQDFPVTPIKLRSLILAVVAGIGLMIFSAPIATLVANVLQNIGVAPIEDNHTFAVLPEFITGLVVLCFLPALCEEFLTRGVILNGLLKRGVVPAIILSAFCFAIMHGNPYQLVHQFVLGVAMAYLVVVTRNILYSVIVHFTNNFISLVLSALTYSQLDTAVETTEEASPIVGIIVLAVMVVVGAILSFVVLREITHEAILEKVEKHPESRQSYIKKKDAGSFVNYVEKLGRWSLDLSDGKEKLSPVFFFGIFVAVGILVLNTVTMVVL